MNILVTGANGQLGNEMRRVSLDSRNRYLFTDVNELDITDATAVRNMLKKRADRCDCKLCCLYECRQGGR